jgi:hypothetical protein
MTKHPSDEEIKQIVTKRKQLAQELIGALMLTDKQEQSNRLKQLEARYGQAEVDRELASYRNRANMLNNPDNENIVFYGEYAEYYRRYGGDRPFLTMEEYIEANDEAAPLIIKHELNQPMTKDEQERYAYLSDLMLKEAVFWDDIVPENPPATMPDVDLPPIKIIVPDLAAGHPLSSYPLCPNDGFPLIIIDNELTCCFERLNHCLGQRVVVDVIKRGKTAYYVFDDGHELPLLCGCCGQSLQVDDLAGSLEEVRGRRLTGMSMETRIIEEENREYERLVLEFSKPGLFSQIMRLPVAFEVAAELRHPSPAPTRKPGSTSKKKVRSQKKSRSRKKRGRRRKK